MIRRLLLTLGVVVLAGTTTPPIARAQVDSDAAFLRMLYQLAAPTNGVDSNPTVGTTAVLLVKNAPSRYALMVSNLSSYDCYVLPSPLVSGNNGYKVAASGGVLVMNVKDDLMLPSREWWAKCGAANIPLAVHEEFLQ